MRAIDEVEAALPEKGFAERAFEQKASRRAKPREQKISRSTHGTTQTKFIGKKDLNKEKASPEANKYWSFAGTRATAAPREMPSVFLLSLFPLNSLFIFLHNWIHKRYDPLPSSGNTMAGFPFPLF